MGQTRDYDWSKGLNRSLYIRAECLNIYSLNLSVIRLPL